MPESPNPLTPQDQIDWHGMLHDLEKSVELMSDALTAVHMSVRRIVMAEAWLPQKGAEPAPVASAPEPPVAAAASEEPPAVEPAPVPEAVEQSSSRAEPLAVAAMQMSVPEATIEQPMAVEEEPEAMVEIAVPPTAAEHAASEELVERFVEASREETPVEPVASAPVAQDDEAAREAVRRTVEQSRVELSGYAAQVDTAPMPSPVPAASDDEDAREAVRRAVEQTKAEMAGGYVAQPAAPVAPVMPQRASDEEQDAREAVRRVVEQARAEMAGGGLTDAAQIPPPPPPRTLPQRPVNPVHLLPTLTIEDPESRVELARVYALLQSLGIAAQSSLLNYTSRQVSVQLGADAARVTPDAFVAAVKATLGRDSTATIDGANVIVELGEETGAGKVEAA
jgi:hypothetical protein